MRAICLLLCLCVFGAALPPLPSSPTIVRKPRLASPKETAFRAAALPMAVFRTDYCYWDFPPPVANTGQVTSNGQNIIFTFTNLIAFIDVKTNNGPWFRKRSAPYPPRGGTMIVTNRAQVGEIIMFRSGWTWVTQ